MTKAERLRYKTNWRFALNSSGKNSGPLASRPNFRAAVALKDHLYRESEDYQPPILPQDQDRLPKDNAFSETYRKGPRVDKTIGWKILAVFIIFFEFEGIEFNSTTKRQRKNDKTWENYERFFHSKKSTKRKR